MGSSGSSGGKSTGVSESISQYINDAISQSTGYSQNSSISGTIDSRLSNLQADILEKRESLANDYFFPELQKSIAETQTGSAASNALMEQNANAINTAYNASQKATEQTLAQQGLTGGRNGVNAALTAANNRARSSSLAQAYHNQLLSNQQNKATLLAMMSDNIAKPTSSAQYHEASQSQGTSENQSTSVSHGEGDSHSYSNNRAKNFGKNASLNIGIS